MRLLWSPPRFLRKPAVIALSLSALVLGVGGAVYNLLPLVTGVSRTKLASIPPDFAFSVTSITVSPDGTRVAYLVPSGEGAHAVVDGSKESPVVDGPFLFSPDNRHYAYRSRVLDRGQAMVRDRVETRYNNLVVGDYGFTRNGTLVYRTELGAPGIVVLDSGDSREERKYEWVGSLVVDPRHDRIGYVARKAGKRILVLDREEITTYDDVGTPVFSADGTIVAFPAAKEGAWFLVTRSGASETTSKPYAAIGAGVGSITFSSHGQRIAYVGKTNDGEEIVVDHEKYGTYDSVSSPTFSPDGSHLAYLATLAGRTALYLDGVSVPLGITPALSSLALSRDGSLLTLAFGAGVSTLSGVVVLDTRTSTKTVFDSAPENDEPAVFSPDGHVMAYRGVTQDRQKYSVTIWPSSKRRRVTYYDFVTKPTFSPDGKFISYVAVSQRTIWRIRERIRIE